MPKPHILVISRFTDHSLGVSGELPWMNFKRNKKRKKEEEIKPWSAMDTWPR